MTATEFWERFTTNEVFIRDELKRKDLSTSPALEAFGLALRDYCDGLSFIIWSPENTLNHVLTISAACNPDYFLPANHLGDHAPTLPHWELQILIPPKTEYTEAYLESSIPLDGVELKVKHLKAAVTCYFDEDQTCGITFALPFMFKEKDQDDLWEELHFFLTQALGERRFAEQIAYVDITYEPEDYFEYVTIDHLDEHIKSFIDG